MSLWRNWSWRCFNLLLGWKFYMIYAHIIHLSARSGMLFIRHKFLHLVVLVMEILKTKMKKWLLMTRGMPTQISGVGAMFLLFLFSKTFFSFFVLETILQHRPQLMVGTSVWFPSDRQASWHLFIFIDHVAFWSHVYVSFSSR